jgi:hypothetical protein
MSFQRVPAGNGLQWLTEAVEIILKNPAAFGLMALVVGVIGAVPLLGGLVLLLLGPALYGGIMYAAREQEAGRLAELPMLFQVFREEGKVGRMMMLCLPSVAAVVLVSVLAAVLVGGALFGAGVSGVAGSDGTALGVGLGLGVLLIGLLALVAGLAAFALTFFATPRVMLDAAEPIAAMKDSLQACLANLGAVLLYAVLVLAAALLLALLLSWIPLIGPLLITAVLAPVTSVAAFVAWRQVYRQAITQELPPAVPPAAPEL